MRRNSAAALGARNKATVNVAAAWSMAAVCRATGLGQHTLRVWERRFGFPCPVRLPSGHRRYPSDQVERLRLIARAIAGGHRASAVVPLDVESLQGLLAAHARIESGAAAFAERLIALVRSFDRVGLNIELQRAIAELGARAFLHERVVPLVETVGEEWVAGTLDIRNEHFLSEVLIDTLRSLRAPLETSGPGRPVMLTTLPGEEHALGLHMAALTIALAGGRAIVLGTQMPRPEIVATARTLHPLAVGLTVTATTATAETARQINELADELPAGVRLWLGGAGCRVLTGLARDVHRMPTLDHIGHAVAALPAH
jgi:methanogenic corrinoid protein MtbC1